MSDMATFLIWLAVIAIGSQIIAVLIMWQLQRLTLLELRALDRRGELTEEERLLRVGQEARVTAEATAELIMELQQKVNARDQL